MIYRHRYDPVHIIIPRVDIKIGIVFISHFVDTHRGVALVVISHSVDTHRGVALVISHRVDNRRGVSLVANSDCVYTRQELARVVINNRVDTRHARMELPSATVLTFAVELPLLSTTMFTFNI